MAVNPNIKKKADDIRNKVYGKEVRESLASGLEAMSSDVVETVGRQDEVEGQFQDVIDNTTGKDVISAPEIIAARNGESNLKARLDKEKNEVTAQLAQIAINVKTYGAIGDGTTDDTVAIQNAINSLKSGDRLFFPAGRYLVSDILFNKSNIVYEGVDKNVSVLVMKGDNTKGIGEVSGNDILFESLGFDGNNNTAMSMYMLEVKENSRRFRLNNCSLLRLKGLGAQTSTGGQYALKIDLNDVVDFEITNNEFSEVSNMGDKLSAQFGFAGFIMFSGTNIAVPSKGMIRNNSFDKTYTEFGLDWTSEEKQLDLDGDGIRFYYEGTLSNDTFDITIDNNKFKRCQKRAVKITGIGGIKITNNDMDFEEVIAGDPVSSCSVRVSNANSFVFKGNTVTGRVNRIIEVMSSSEVEIEYTEYRSSLLSKNILILIEDSQQISIKNLGIDYRLGGELSYYNGVILLRGSVKDLTVDGVRVKNSETSNNKISNNSYLLATQSTASNQLVENIRINDVRTDGISTFIRLGTNAIYKNIDINNVYGEDCSTFIYGYFDVDTPTDALKIKNVTVQTKESANVFLLRDRVGTISNLAIESISIIDTVARTTDYIMDIQNIVDLTLYDVLYKGTASDEYLVYLRDSDGFSVLRNDFPGQFRVYNARNGRFINNTVNDRIYFEASENVEIVNTVAKRATSAATGSNTNVTVVNDVIF